MHSDICSPDLYKGLALDKTHHWDQVGCANPHLIMHPAGGNRMSINKCFKACQWSRPRWLGESYSRGIYVGNGPTTLLYVSRLNSFGSHIFWASGPYYDKDNEIIGCVDRKHCKWKGACTATGAKAVGFVHRVWILQVDALPMGGVRGNLTGSMFIDNPDHSKWILSLLMTYPRNLIEQVFVHLITSLLNMVNKYESISL